MIQFCIMSGHEGRLQPAKKIYFTLMGGLELTMPTLAKQILASRQQSADGGPPPVQSHFFLTIMGGVEIRLPTLAEEFLDLREMIRGGVLTIGDWDRCLAQLGRSNVSISSFTLMGGFEESRPPAESDEIDSLALQRHLGNISESSGRVLQLGVGQRESERWAVVRQAVVVSA